MEVNFSRRRVVLLGVLLLIFVSAPVVAYECTEESVKNFVLTEFASTHTIDKESVEVLESKFYQLYGKEVFLADIRVVEDKIIPFYVLCDTGEVYSYREPSFSEVTEIQKIDRDLWQKMQTVGENEEIDIIVWKDLLLSPDLEIANAQLKQKGMLLEKTSILSLTECDGELARKKEFDISAKGEECQPTQPVMLVGKATKAEIDEISELNWIISISYNAPGEVEVETFVDEPGGGEYKPLGRDALFYYRLSILLVVVIVFLIIAMVLIWARLRRKHGLHELSGNKGDFDR